MVAQRLDKCIENLQARVDTLTKQIHSASGKWAPERVGYLENERKFLQESLQHVKKLKVSIFKHNKAQSSILHLMSDNQCLVRLF